mgnify:CR=1 FL=1
MTYVRSTLRSRGGVARTVDEVIRSHPLLPLCCTRLALFEMEDEGRSRGLLPPSPRFFADRLNVWRDEGSVTSEQFVVLRDAAAEQADCSGSGEEIRSSGIRGPGASQTSVCGRYSHDRSIRRGERDAASGRMHMPGILCLRMWCALPPQCPNKKPVAPEMIVCIITHMTPGFEGSVDRSHWHPVLSSSSSRVRCHSRCLQPLLERGRRCGWEGRGPGSITATPIPYGERAMIARSWAAD